MNDSFTEIKRFLEFNGLHYSEIFKTRVIASKNGKVIYDDETECSIVYDERYEQFTLNIMWATTDAVWRNLGLHGKYNTNFQDFKQENGDLLVCAEQFQIQVKKL